MAFVRRVLKLVKFSCLGQKEDTEAVVAQSQPIEEGELALDLRGMDSSEDSLSGDGDVSIILYSRSPKALPDSVVIPPQRNDGVTIREKGGLGTERRKGNSTLKNIIIIWLRRRVARGRVAPHPTELK